MSLEGTIEKSQYKWAWLLVTGTIFLLLISIPLSLIISFFLGTEPFGSRFGFVFIGQLLSDTFGIYDSTDFAMSFWGYVILGVISFIIGIATAKTYTWVRPAYSETRGTSQYNKGKWHDHSISVHHDESTYEAPDDAEVWLKGIGAFIALYILIFIIKFIGGLLIGLISGAIITGVIKSRYSTGYAFKISLISLGVGVGIAILIGIVSSMF